MANKAKFKLRAVAEVPARQRSSIYRDILTEFVSSQLPAALVELPDRKPFSIYQGLSKARSKDLLDKVQVLVRHNDVYLQRATLK